MKHLNRARISALQILAEYYCLQNKDIAKIFRRREPTPSDLRDARRNMVALLSEGLVNRLPYFDLQTEGVGWVYGLSDKGVMDYGGKTFDEHSARTLDHELEISNFHIALKPLCDERGLELYWQQTELKRGIHPDALFALTNAKGTYYFFLEIEKSKPGKYVNGEPGIIRKLAKYAEYYDTDQCGKDWNFRKFRVVIVQTNDTRRHNLLKALRENEKLNRRMFWLTIDPFYKGDIGGEIFRTPADPETGRYSFLLL